MSHDNFETFRLFAEDADRIIDPRTVKVALDVGSRDAEVAIYLKQHYPNAVVYAFECNPAAVELCRRHIGAHEDIVLEPRAVSDSEGPIAFYAIDPAKTITAHEDGNIGASSLYRANNSYPYEKYVQNQIVVDSITLERWARTNFVNSIDVIWMDLQGAELRALRGLRNLITSVKLIYLEMTYKEIYVDQPLAHEVRAFMTRNGFELVQQYNASEWFGDELFCQRQLLSWGKLLFLRSRHSPLGRKAAQRLTRGCFPKMSC